MQIVKVPLSNSLDDKTLSCTEVPHEIVNSLKEIESLDNSKIIDFSKFSIDEIYFDPSNLKEAMFNIYNHSKEYFEKNFKVFFLGGDHSISYPILKAFKKLEENPLLILFDAHIDCLKINSSDSDNLKSPNNRQWLKALVESGFYANDIIIISTRNFLLEELEFIQKNKITLIKMDLLYEDLHEISDVVMERARKSSGFYISLDISSVDPAFAPGTNYIEPGGLSSLDILYFIKRLVLVNNFKGGDIVEVDRLKDLNKMTIKLAARLLAEMI
jgi:arginase family enzyme